MTIKELCKKQIKCSVCPYLPICGDSPENYNLGVDLEVTNAIIETAKELEQEPCYNPDEWCHDCSEYNHDKHCCPRYNKVIRNAVEEMKQPKVGHWIANAPQYDMLNPQYICSECGNAHTRTTPYCEICGARMIEPQESEGVRND